MRAASLAHLRSGVQPFTAAQPRGKQQPVQARFGGGGGPGGDRRLIMPGQQQDAGGGRLVLPGQPGGGTPPRSGGQLSGGGGGLVGPGMPPPVQNFRPPPGFMNADGPAAQDTGMSTDEMLSRLRSLSGHWHQLAQLLPALQRAGIDGMGVEEATGLERKLQNVWATAAQVYESIRGVVAPPVLADFDGEGGEHRLYELRFLSVKQRAPAATYIAENGFGPAESQMLARAIKEHERRDGRREGFADTPADVLAYKYFRDAQECRRKDDVEATAKKGLAVAETDDARAKLSALLEGESSAQSPALPTANLVMLRLSRDELGFRPLAVAGQLGGATAAQVLGAPKVSSEGVFGNFRVPPEGANHEWVALPNWSLLTLAGHPVALTIADCSQVPQVRASSAAKTEDELKRLVGVGILVADIAAEDKRVKPECYYLAADAAGGAVRLAAGGDVGEGAAVLGPVLFVARPPSRETPAATTSELMSL